ncbi:aminotransferase class V-fold PLP-dependent enzyme [Halorubrum sp. JWXQ-INN 858]|uniref:aminotransferase class V-fold PLP-dependent enzyme n=1 Tax=Halorubrum sp. JWXQ-INN 858 TaxID=2690782 RepID=UPI0013589B94|nr:aminotransferase class V-fold PLP-dependent enzyme [Halorubrum sp. JWXQ-INN 858]MWV65796.1 aminotransferase class V-fold PLP-dependent enzyme [Halorubrum sp. JWXQ-INN 858]
MDPLDLRADAPALSEATYLNYGAHGPSTRSVVEAAESMLERHEYGSATADPYEVAFASYDDARERIAAFIGGEGDDVALTESTTDAINRIAGAIDWEPGDIVVRTDLEHPAGVLPWRRLEREGVEVRVVDTAGGRIDVDAFADAVADAELACFSALTWTHGTVLPVRELCEIAADAGAFSLVDAVQVPGHRRMDVAEWGADAVAAAGHKWPLGPWGSGFLHVDRDAAAALSPRAVGYRSVTEPTGDGLAYEPGARRFEVGTTSPAPHAGLVAALDAVEAVGLDAIETRIAALTDRLKAGIDEERLLSPSGFESGLVTVAVDDPEAVVERLGERGIVVRSLPHPEAVRVSVHAVTTEAEVDAVAAALSEVV